MAKLYTYFTHGEFGHIDHHFEQAFIIDVLRATTTMIVALNNGIEKIYPVESVEEAISLKKKLAGIDKAGPLLAGERRGEKISGFDLGNSPYDFLEGSFSGNLVIMTTSNGTYAIRKSLGIDKIHILSNLNLKKTAESVDKNKNTAIICAGSHMEFSIEDMICAGLFIKQICDDSNWQYNDQSIVAQSYIDAHFGTSSPLPEAVFGQIKNGIHAKRLFDLNSEKDVKFSCQFDLYYATASYNGQTIVLDK